MMCEITKKCFCIVFSFVTLFYKQTEGRVAGKVGYSNNYYSGKCFCVFI